MATNESQEPPHTSNTMELQTAAEHATSQEHADMDDAAATTEKGTASEEQRDTKQVETSGDTPSDASSENVENGQSDEEKGMEKPQEKEPSIKGGRSKGKIAVIMLALMLAVFLAALDVTIITTALPTISEDFHSTAGYTWIGSAFLLANSASIPSWGKVSDIFGRKPMLLLANVVFMVGSLVAALANSIGMLIAARAVQGIGGGGLIILVNIVIGDLFSLRSRGAFYGLIGGVWAIASSIGPIIGGAFTQHVTWRWCFYINLPLDGIAFFILLFFLDLKTPRTPFMEGLKAIDWVGSLTIVGGTLMFLFGLQYGGVSHPWDSAEVLCLLIFGVVTWALFGFWEWKFAKYPIMPMGLFASVSRFATLAVVFFHGFVFISGSYYLPLYFQAIRGAQPLMSGVDLLPTALSLAIASIGTGVFIKKTGMFLPPIYFGMFMMTLGYGLFIDFDADSSWAKIICFQIVAGLGIGPIFQAPIIALQAHINPRDIGTATATLGFVRQLATSTSVVIGEVVFQNEMKKKAGHLAKVLGPQLAEQLGGANAGANTRLIDQLPPAERRPVRVAFADSLQPMWIMYTAFAGAGLLVSFAIRKKALSTKHEETKTGLEAEKENAAARQAERDAKKAHKRDSQDRTPPRTPRTPQTPRTAAIEEEEKATDVEAAGDAASNKRALPQTAVHKRTRSEDPRDMSRRSKGMPRLSVDTQGDRQQGRPRTNSNRMSRQSGEYTSATPRSANYQGALPAGKSVEYPSATPRSANYIGQWPPYNPEDSYGLNRQGGNPAILSPSSRENETRTFPTHRTESNRVSRQSGDFAVSSPHSLQQYSARPRSLPRDSMRDRRQSQDYSRDALRSPDDLRRPGSGYRRDENRNSRRSGEFATQDRAYESDAPRRRARRDSNKMKCRSGDYTQHPPRRRKSSASVHRFSAALDGLYRGPQR